MPSSETEVVNLALTALGFEPVAALNESNDRARVASRWYAPTRDELLRAANWNFAQTRVDLAQVLPNPAWGTFYAYQLPADCLMVLDTNLDALDAWRIEGRTLITAAAAVSILYVAQVEDPARWDALFTEAVVDKLAFRFCYPLARSAQLADVLYRKSEESLKRAKSRDGQEGRHLKRFLSDVLTRGR